MHDRLFYHRFTYRVRTCHAHSRQLLEAVSRLTPRRIRPRAAHLLFRVLGMFDSGSKFFPACRAIKVNNCAPPIPRRGHLFSRGAFEP